MSTFKKTFIIAVSINLIIMIIGFGMNREFAAFLAGISILEILIGIILAIIPYSREVGKAVLSVAGICFLIGFSICTATFRIR